MEIYPRPPICLESDVLVLGCHFRHVFMVFCCRGDQVIGEDFTRWRSGTREEVVNEVNPFRIVDPRQW